jgi:hypothetical protein
MPNGRIIFHVMSVMQNTSTTSNFQSSLKSLKQVHTLSCEYRQQVSTQCTMHILALMILAHAAALASSFSLLPHHYVRSSSTSLHAEQTKPSLLFDEKKADFCRGYLNKHHSDVLCHFAEAYSEPGLEQQRRNSFSGGSYKIVNAQVTEISPDSME